MRKMRNRFIAWNYVAIIVSLIMLAFPADSQACYSNPVADIDVIASACGCINCPRLELEFSGENSYSTGGYSIVEYKWTFPDGLHSGVYQFYQFNAAGDYTIYLEVRDNNGEGTWSDPVSVTIHINDASTFYVAVNGDDVNNTGTSVESPFATIQHAIDLGCDGSTIYLLDGTYQQNVDTFWGRSITLQSLSGDPTTVIIDGNYDVNGPGTVVLVDGAVTIKDITITGGYSESVGGGIYCTNNTCYGDTGTPAVLENCIIYGNHASLGGGGLYNERDLLEIKYCQFDSNTVASGYAGGAIYSYGDNDECVVRNCLFTGNTAGIGGGIALAVDNEMDVLNSTFYGNAALDTSRGGALSSSNVTGDECTLNLSNSILWDNTPNEIDSTYHNIWVSFCDIEGCGGSGSGNWNSGCGVDLGYNIAQDPCFVSISTPFDLHISSTSSPCYNNGDPSYSPETGETDIDGDDRVLYNVIDMGYDEYKIITQLTVNISLGGTEARWRLLLQDGAGYECYDDNWYSNGDTISGLTPGSNYYLAAKDVKGYVPGGDKTYESEMEGYWLTDAITLDSGANTETVWYGVAATVYVSRYTGSNSGTGNYYSPFQTIQYAIYSDIGLTIDVASGTYYENIYIDRTVNITGDPASTTKIFGLSSTQSAVTFNQLSAGSITNFEITSGRGNYGAGVYDLCYSNNTIKNCIIYGNTANVLSGLGGYGGGVYTVGRLNIENCTIYGNSAGYGGNDGDQIYSYALATAPLVIKDSIIEGLYASYPSGFFDTEDCAYRYTHPVDDGGNTNH